MFSRWPGFMSQITTLEMLTYHLKIDRFKLLAVNANKREIGFRTNHLEC